MREILSLIKMVMLANSVRTENVIRTEQIPEQKNEVDLNAEANLKKTSFVRCVVHRFDRSQSIVHVSKDHEPVTCEAQSASAIKSRVENVFLTFTNGRSFIFDHIGTQNRPEITKHRQ